MKKIHELIKTAELISQNLSRDPESPESDEFENWLNHSSRNHKLYQRILDEKNREQRDTFFNAIDKEKAWAELLVSLDKKSSNVKFLKFTRRVAAILLPMMIIGGIWMFLQNRDEVQSSMNTADIFPGSKGAVLILNDGSRLDLRKLQSGNIAQQAHTNIIKLNDGQLLYNDSTATQPVRPLTDSQLNTLVTSRGEEYSLTLSDGTKVFLNSMTKLEFPVSFDGNKREIFLEGEAYFEVAKNDTKPFIVNVNNKANVKVLGTHFNIHAYNDENTIRTTLIEGSVLVSSSVSPAASLPDRQSGQFLSPGEQATIDANGQISVTTVDAKRFAAWKDGLYAFNNQSLEDIMKTLSRWYDLEYEFENENLKKICFEGGLNKYNDIGPVLDIIQSTGKVKIKVEGRKIVFM